VFEQMARLYGHDFEVVAAPNGLERIGPRRHR
jgi:hypothetical protein